MRGHLGLLEHGKIVQKYYTYKILSGIQYLTNLTVEWLCNEK